MFKQILKRLGAVLTRDRVISRLLAAWCTYIAVLVSKNEGFATLAFLQEEVSLAKLALFTFLFFAAFTVVAAVAGRLRTDSWFLLFSSTVCVTRWLLEYDSEKNQVRFWLAVTLAYTFFVLFFLYDNRGLWRKWKPGNRTTAIFAAVCGLILCTALSVITCLRYKTFSSPNYDFGLFCNMFYNMKKTGLPLITSERDRLLSHFAVHLSPIYYLLLPFYFIFPSPMTLQVGQAAALALGVIPILLLCRQKNLSGKVTLAVTALYALYPAMNASCFYDIHENCFLPLFLLLTFYFFEAKKPIPMYVSAALVLCVKEDAAVYLLLFALFVLLSRKNYLHGGILAAMAVGYFFFATYLINHYGDGVMEYRYTNLMYFDEDGLFGVIRTALVNPGYVLTQIFLTSDSAWDKVAYFLQLFLPLGMIPFCTNKPSRWLLLVPTLINLMTLYRYQYDIGFQYHFGITAFLFYAMILNLQNLRRPTARNLLGIASAACLCLYLITVVPKVNTYLNRWNSGKEKYERMDAILDTIPEDASLCASSFLLAHVADRDTVYEVGYHHYVPDTDYVALDERYSSYSTDLACYLEDGDYQIYAEEPGLVMILIKVKK